MSAMAMWQPLSAYTSAMRLPMPLAAPVTRATLSFTLIRVLLRVFVDFVATPVGRRRLRPARCRKVRSFLARGGFRVHAQIAQFAVQVRAFHAHCLGEFADAAATALQLAQQVGALELLACL